MKLLQTNIIKIGEQEYPIKLSIRAMIEYEQMTGSSISTLKTLEDVTMIFYCCMKAGGYPGMYGDFLDLIDENIDALNQFKEALIEPDAEKKEEAR